MRVPYKLDDAEKDTLSLGIFYFRQDWKRITTLSLSPDAYRDIFLWDARRALGYGDSIQVQINLIPADKDTGDAVDTTLYVCSYLGDFDGDRDVDFDDLDRIRMGWKVQDITCDIGPVQGTPPELYPSPDGKVDFEDLVVFALMWNWWHEKYRAVAKPLAKIVLPSQDAPVEVRSEVEGGRLRVWVVSRRGDLGAYEVRLWYPSDVLEVKEVHRGNALGREGVIFLEHRAEGDVLVNAAKFGSGKGEGNFLVVVDFRILRQWDKVALKVGYDLRAE